MSNAQLSSSLEVAQMCGITRRAVLYDIQRGHLRANRLSGPGSPYVIDRADAEAYAARRRGARK